MVLAHRTISVAFSYMTAAPLTWLLDLPFGAGPAQHRRADDTRAIHEPDRHGAVSVPPEDVGLAVPVDIFHALDGPVDGDSADHGRAGNGGAVHEPDRHGAVSVPPENVRLAVTVEVTHGLDGPGSGDG